MLPSPLRLGLSLHLWPIERSIIRCKFSIMKGFRSAGLSQEWHGYIGCGGETIVANDTPEFQRNLAGRQ